MLERVMLERVMRDRVMRERVVLTGDSPERKRPLDDRRTAERQFVLQLTLPPPWHRMNRVRVWQGVVF
jgi:hypothetical protein